MVKQYRNFPQSEIACHCGCGTNNVSDAFMQKIVAARLEANTPFTTSCFCRCKKHNRDVSGSPTSSHEASETKECFATDINEDNTYKRMQILVSLINAGIRRIGVYPWGIHADDDPNKPQALWYGA